MGDIKKDLSGTSIPTVNVNEIATNTSGIVAESFNPFGDDNGQAFSISDDIDTEQKTDEPLNLSDIEEIASDVRKTLDMNKLYEVLFK